MRKQYLYLVLAIIISFTKLCAQIYPIQLTTQLTLPYSGYVGDYADPMSEKLRMIAVLNDFSVAQHSVRLHIEIRGNGISIVSKPNLPHAPIVLYPGTPTQISGTDLASYLKTSNLDFSGIDVAEYEKRKTLPEGYYTFCVTAYDYYSASPKQLSNQSCAMAWITLSDPPMLNMPLCGSNITPTLNPQQLIFQWTPMQMGSPNAVNNTHYKFELFEIRPATANPNDIVQSTLPVYSTITDQTFLNYGITEPMLLQNMGYVWRVQALDKSGRETFKNLGYSQICNFTYNSIAEELAKGVEIKLDGKANNYRQNYYWWNIEGSVSGYELRIRKKGTEEWFPYTTSDANIKVSQLEENNTYEAQVRGIVGNSQTDWSNTVIITTPPKPVFVCNNNNIPPSNILQSQPLSALPVGSILTIGQFEMVVREATPLGMPGHFKGKGSILAINTANLLVTFDDILVNDNYEVTAGFATAASDGVELMESDFDLNEAKEHASYVSGSIDSVYIQGNEVCVITETDPSPRCFLKEEGKPFVLRDDEGNEYVVSADGNIENTPGGYFELSADTSLSKASKDHVVIFKASANQQYGFDEYKYAPLYKDYEILQLTGKDKYFVSWKGIGEGKSDEVLAQVTIKDFDKSKLKFKTLNGTTLNYSSAGNECKLSVSSAAETVYAEYNGTRVGKLNVESLKEKKRTVYLVSVNNTPLPTPNAELINIFKQANITLEVKTGKPLQVNYDVNNNGLDEADATLMNKYSDEMRAIRDAYKKQDSTYDKNAYYLFVVPKFSGNQQGYMVRGKGVGFIAQNVNAKTITHEVAHGAFGLEHSFPKTTQGSTNNLMDYASGTQLTKAQWDQMHSYLPTVSWFDEGEDAAFTVSDIFKTILGEECYNNFLQQDGIIPPCFWQEQPTVISGIDIPTVCGIVDGVYITIKDLISTAKFISCINPGYIGYDTYECKQVRENTYETAMLLKSIVTDAKQREQFCNILKTEYALWYGNTACFTPQCKYSQGKFIFDVTSMFIGAGEVKAAMKGGLSIAKIAAVFKRVPRTIKNVNKALVNFGGKFKKVAVQYSLSIMLSTAEVDIAKIDNLTGALNPNKWINDPAKVLAIVEDIDYVDAQKVAKKGSVELVSDAKGNLGWKEKGIGLKVFKNVSFDDFAKTITGATSDQAKKAYQLWGEEKWGELENFFKQNNINLYKGNKYPPYNGFIYSKESKLNVNFEFDRYGGENINGHFVDGGRYVSPKGSSFGGRALPLETKNLPYRKYRVIKEIPLVLEGPAIPWFNEVGEGVQYKLPYSIDYLKSNGFIIEIQ